MSLSADTLLDRIHLKSQLQKWRMLAVLALVIGVIVGIERAAPQSTVRSDHIARLTVDGIVDDDVERDELIAKLKDDSKVKAVIVRIDTPGGSAVGGEELYLQLRDLAKTKPVVAVMRSIATSAGYMTALGADYIVAREGTITGSIGVLMQTAEFTEMAEKLGITPISVKSTPLKGSPSPLEKTTPEATAALQAMIDEFYHHFVNMVSERRNMPHEVALRLADGRVFSGGQAVKLKLVDALGGENEAIAWMHQNRNVSTTLPVEDVKPERKDDSFLKRISESAAAKILPEAFTTLDGLVSIWHPTTQIQ